MYSNCLIIDVCKTSYINIAIVYEFQSVNVYMNGDQCYIVRYKYIFILFTNYNLKYIFIHYI